MEVVQCLSGKTLHAMHEAISTGRMASTMGAQIFFQRLGQLEPIGNSNKRKRTAETHVVLGKLQEKFRVVHIPDVWSELFRVARTVDSIRAPENVEQLRDTIQNLNAWLKRFPPRYCQGGSGKNDD